MMMKKSFFTIQRIFFVLFSLIFLKIIFYKWDGFSYYMKFIDFLPNLSLAFILWTVIGVLFSLVLWLTAFLLSCVISQLRMSIRLEHVTFYFVSIFLALFIKWGFLSSFSFSETFGLSRSMILMMGGILGVVIILLTHKHTERIINEFNNRITPLFWLFLFLLILAMPFYGSLFLRHFEAKGVSDSNVPSNEKRPNIILVTWDAMSAQDMEVYGYFRPTTPFISEWAKDAVIFNKAYSSSNWTCPTTMTLMTGQQPWTHKIWYEAIYNPVNNYEKSLPFVLKDHGYATYAFVQNNQAHPDVLGLSNAFLVNDKYHTFHSVKNAWNWHLESVRFFIYDLTNNHMVAVMISEHPIFWNLFSFLVSDSGENTTPSEKIYNRFLEYISRNKKQPFFAWLHTLPPHGDYLPPKPYMGAFGDNNKFDIPKKQREFFHKEYNPRQQADVDILRKRYDEFILYSDQEFKNFFLKLSETLNLSNTIIIFSSDHGESFSHNYQGHFGPHLFEQLVHVPLIFKIPGEGKGRIIDTPVAQIDIAPTILALAEIPVPEWMEGRPLIPLLEGKFLEPQPIFSMQFINASALGNNPITKGTIAVWDGDYKFIYYLDDKKLLLFNLRDDPGETHNLINKKPEIAQKLERLIKENLALANKKITSSAEH
jgi:arylsulfatase A-like enzyme